MENFIVYLFDIFSIISLVFLPAFLPFPYSTPHSHPITPGKHSFSSAYLFGTTGLPSFLFICFPQTPDSCQVFNPPDTLLEILVKVKLISISATKVSALNDIPTGVIRNRYIKTIYVYINILRI